MKCWQTSWCRESLYQNQEEGSNLNMINILLLKGCFWTLTYKSLCACQSLWRRHGLCACWSGQWELRETTVSNDPASLDMWCSMMWFLSCTSQSSFAQTDGHSDVQRAWRALGPALPFQHAWLVQRWHLHSDCKAKKVLKKLIWCFWAAPVVWDFAIFSREYFIFQSQILRAIHGFKSSHAPGGGEPKRFICRTKAIGDWLFNVISVVLEVFWGKIRLLFSAEE